LSISEGRNRKVQQSQVHKGYNKWWALKPIYSLVVRAIIYDGLQLSASQQIEAISLAQRII